MNDNEEEYSLKNIIFKSVPKFLKTIPDKYIIFFILICFIPVLQVLCEYKIPLLQKELIDFSISKQKLSYKDLKNLILYISIYVLSLLIFNISYSKFITSLSKYLYHYYYKLTTNLKKEKINKLGIGYLGDVISRDTEASTYLFDPGIFAFFISVFQIIFIMKLIYLWENKIFYLIVFFYIITIILSILSSLLKSKYFAECRNKSPKVANEIFNIYNNLFTIRSYFQKDKFDKKVYMTIKDLYKSVNKNTTIPGLINIILLFSKYLFTIIVTIFSLFLIIEKKISFGILIAIISYSQILFSPIDKFQQILSNITASDIGIIRLEYLREISKEQNFDYSKKFIPLEKINKIEFKNIQFSYKNEKDQVFTENNIKKYIDISFSINDKEKLGIVGLTGEGKTTLLKLFYQEITPEIGEILINEKNINFIPYKFYNYFLNLYPQEPEIFNDDIVFNITLGRKQIYFDEKEKIIEKIKNNIIELFSSISKIIKLNKNDKIKFKLIKNLLNRYKKFEYILQAFDISIYEENIKNINYSDYLLFVNNLLEKEDFYNLFALLEFNKNYCIKERVDEIIKKFEIEYLSGRNLGRNGANISGGEKQKIAFARFLLKEDYGFFLLDEPFTSLDAVNEKKLLSIAKEELKEKTGFIISHKFNILCELATTFIVLDKGKIQQKGTHSDLIKQEGLYKKIFDHFIEQRNIKNE